MPPSPCIELNPPQQRQLLKIARDSIKLGLDAGTPLNVDLTALDPELGETAAVFVTLSLDGQLRGCIGSLQAQEALGQAVANSAFNAAFRDPRFDRVAALELDRIEIEISVLSPLESWQPDSRESLLGELRPGIDGLWIKSAPRKNLSVN
jgi:AmmeMemoRadiSam system protein A